MAKAAAGGGGADSSVADHAPRARALGVNGVPVQMAERGQLLALKCEMPQCWGGFVASEDIRVGELTIRFLVEAEHSNGSAAVFEVDVPAGARVPAPHSHDAYEETMYGVEGTLTWTVEGVQHPLVRATMCASSAARFTASST